MAKHQDEFDNFRQYRIPKINRLTELQLLEMDKEIQGFMVQKEIGFISKMKVMIFDERAWLKDKNALNKDNSIIINDFKPATYFPNGKLKENCDSKPILWEQLQEDLKQYWKWKSSKNRFEQQKIKGLEKLASSLSIPESW